jgi:hypothetical protein
LICDKRRVAIICTEEEEEEKEEEKEEEEEEMREGRGGRLSGHNFNFTDIFTDDY